MISPIHDASARQNSGEPSPVLGRGGKGNSRPRNPGIAEVDDEAAELVDRSTKELRRAWRTLHHTGPPLSLSRDLIIRGLANKLPLITRDRTEDSAGLRIPAAEIEQLVSSRVHRWLLDPGRIYKAISARFPDPSMQRRLIARAEEIGKRWPELPVSRKRAVLTPLIERIEVSLDQIDIRLRPLRLNALLDVAATPLQRVTDDDTEILSVPIRVRRAGREIRMVIEGTDPFAAAKPDARLIKLLLKARRFNAALVDSDGVPFAAPAQREGVSRSYFTRLVRLSYLAPDITQAILDGRQPSDFTAEKLLEHSRLPLAWRDQRTVLGFA